MKLTLVFIVFVVFNGVSRCEAKEFNLGFLKGVVVEGFGRINGTETDNNDEMSSKAEQAIKKIIEKHLSGKKKNRVQQLGSKKVVPEENQKVNAENPAIKPQQIPQSINWDENQEARDLINNKVTGGTQAINDLISLLKEREAQNNKGN